MNTKLPSLITACLGLLQATAQNDPAGGAATAPASGTVPSAQAAPAPAISRPNRMAVPPQFGRPTNNLPSPSLIRPPASANTVPNAVPNAAPNTVNVGAPAPPANPTPATVTIPASTTGGLPPAPPTTFPTIPANPPGLIPQPPQGFPRPNTPTAAPQPTSGLVSSSIPTAVPVQIDAASTNAVDVALRSGKFREMPLNQFLEVYAKVAGKTILRPQSLPQMNITFEPVTSLTREELLQAFDSVLALNQITMIPTAEKFVTAVPQAQASMEGARFNTKSLNELAEAGQYTTHVVQLKNVKPSEMQQVITPFAKNKDGIVAIDPTQTLVLRDYAINIKRMLEVIEKVDVVIEQDYLLEVIPIRYGMVSEIYATMSGLIGGGAGGAAGAIPGAGLQGFGRSRNSTGTIGGRRGLGGMGGNSSFGSGIGRNSGVGGYGYGGFSAGMEQVEPGMDGAQFAPQSTAINRSGATGFSAGGGAAGGASFQNRFNSTTRGAQGQGQAQQPPDMIDDARIIPDERSNSLIVYASKKDLEQIKKVVAKVDTLLAQVLIEAIILEVALNDGLNYGISAGQRPKNLGGNPNVRAGGNVNNGGLLNSGASFLTTNAAAALFPGSGGLTYFSQIGSNWDVALSALANDSRVNVVQRPRIQTSHAVPGEFFVGSTVPFISGSFFGGGTFGNQNQYTREQVGVTLSVVPFITPDDLVVMEVNQTIASLGPNQEIGNGTSIPTTQERNASSTLSVRNGDAILLGGYLSTTDSKSRSGVPVLKDIPILGAAFRSNNRTKARTEMLVLMRPTVLPTPIDASKLANQERFDLPGIRTAEREWRHDELRLKKVADKEEEKFNADRQKELEKELRKERRNAPKSDGSDVNNHPLGTIGNP